MTSAKFRSSSLKTIEPSGFREREQRALRVGARYDLRRRDLLTVREYDAGCAPLPHRYARNFRAAL